MKNAQILVTAIIILLTALSYYGYTLLTRANLIETPAQTESKFNKVVAAKPAPLPSIIANNPSNAI